MRIEILNTGTELLLGTTLNTHGKWFGEQLFKLGFRVQRLTTVPDGEAIAQALRECVSRADVVLVTGGLGPTSDDLTREAAAEVLGADLIEDEAATYGYVHEHRHFVEAFRRGEMPEENFAGGSDVVAMLMALYRSAELGRTVRFDEPGLLEYVPQVVRRDT